MKHLPLLFFYFLLGFCFQFPSIAMRYWMMDWVTPAQMAAIFGIVSIPWCLKPLYGFISDSYPVLGYRRRPYMTMGALLSSFMWIILPFCPHDEFIVTLVMTLSSLGLCFADVMADSLLVEIARSESEANKGVIQSYSWMLRFAGGLSASIFGALAYDKLGHVQVFHLNSMIPVTIALLSLCIHETDSSTSVNWRITRSKLTAAVRQPTVHRPALFLFLICVFPPRFAALIADAESAMTASADRLVELDTMIAEAQANRTDEHTTIAEILERHPDIAAEIEEEIKEDKWFAQ